jgi:hypothetical protein
MTDFSIRPSMVFVDGDHLYEGVRRDLDSLTDMLGVGVPVLCHDYLNPKNDTGDYGVRQAVTEWEEAGYTQFMGVFGCSALFVTTDNCRGTHGCLPAEKFVQRRAELLKCYVLRYYTYRLGYFLLHPWQVIRSRLKL